MHEINRISGQENECTNASYRLTGERGGTRGAGGDPGAGTSARNIAGRRPAGVPGPQA